MSEFKPKNPFGINAYYGPEYFCNRVLELENLQNFIINGNSVTLYSLRRLGKTGLIHHFFNQIPEEYKAVYVDIMHTNSTEDFLEELTSSLISQFPNRMGFGKKIWNFVMSLRPTISFDPLTGMPQASFTVEESNAERNVEAIFKFLEEQDFTTIIAIDEFQQIMEYSNKSIDAWLRSQFQQLKNVLFIFSGSKQHLMVELFNSPLRPFYRSTNMLKLEKINQQAYKEFIIEMFSRYKRSISPEITSDILQWTDLHTFYVQQLCNRVFMKSGKTVKENDWKDQANMLLIEQQEYFYSIRQILTKNQWLLLGAIAHHNITYKPTSQTFIKKYGLSSSSSIIKSLNFLIDKGLVYKDFDSEGNQFYAVYDLYLRRWFQQNM